MNCGKPPRCASAAWKLLFTSPPHEWSNTFTVQVIPQNKVIPRTYSSHHVTLRTVVPATGEDSGLRFTLVFPSPISRLPFFKTCPLPFLSSFSSSPEDTSENILIAFSLCNQKFSSIFIPLTLSLESFNSSHIHCSAQRAPLSQTSWLQTLKYLSYHLFTRPQKNLTQWAVPSGQRRKRITFG